ncbi:MAG: SAM hydrolase/SAM-dependent halogenase family protein [Anaerolineales bacterium]
MAIITLMTDFGLKDGNVGVMKGVIWGICPEAQIADLSHLIGAQNIREAALILARSAPYFPKGTVHVVVVDPGVGTKRRAMAAHIGDSYFVCPDNGIITMVLERATAENQPCEYVSLDNPKYHLQHVSHVFHGRDIFSPAAAHLASGVPFASLGSAFSGPVTMALPRPVRTEHGLRGEVIHIDHFGNIASNIRIEDLGKAFESKELIDVRIGRTQIKGLVDTFGERPVGEVIALLGSTGNLIVSLVNGNAAEYLGAKVGDELEAVWPA